MSKYFLIETRGILTLEVFDSLAERIRNEIMKSCLNILTVPQANCSLPLPVITCAASLAHHRLLGCVKDLWLFNIDLTSVSAEHLTSLVSIVTSGVYIKNVSGFDLVTILDSVNSQVLLIRDQSLGSEEAQALVRAMESCVEEVRLGKEATLDIRVLIEYNGQGKCRKMLCHYGSKDRYREQLKIWAKSRNWVIDEGYDFSIKRID